MTQLCAGGWGGDEERKLRGEAQEISTRGYEGGRNQGRFTTPSTPQTSEAKEKSTGWSRSNDGGESFNNNSSVDNLRNTHSNLLSPTHTQCSMRTNIWLILSAMERSCDPISLLQ